VSDGCYFRRNNCLTLNEKIKKINGKCVAPVALVEERPASAWGLRSGSMVARYLNRDLKDPKLNFQNLAILVLRGVHKIISSALAFDLF
jgi:hypothetical protein